MATFLIDLENNALLGKSVHATISTATSTNGTGIDCQLTDGPVHAIFITGNAGDADSAFYVKLQESDAVSGTYTDISGAVSDTYTGASAGDNLAVAITTPYRSLRWVRAVVVTTTSGTVSLPIAVAIVGRKKLTGSGTGYQS